MEDDINLAFENGARDMRIIINEAIEHGDNYRDEKDRILFDLIAINGYTYEEAAKQLGLTKRQAFYRYQQVSRRIVDYLNRARHFTNRGPPMKTPGHETQQLEKLLDKYRFTQPVPPVSARTSCRQKRKRSSGY